MRAASWPIFAALALVWGAGAAFADDADHFDPDAGRFTATLGGDYSTGDYGDPDTTRIRSVSLGLRYARGPWTGRVSVPQLWVTGPGNVLPGTGLVDDQNQPVAVSSSSERGLERCQRFRAQPSVSMVRQREPLRTTRKASAW